MTAQLDLGELIAERLLDLDRNQSWLANRMGVDPATVWRWMNGGARPKSPGVVEKLADVLCIFKRDERAKLATAAGYAVQVGDEDPRDKTENAKESPQAQPDARFLWDAAAEWGRTMTGWYDIPDHARSSWAGMTLHTLSLLGKRFTPEGVLALCAAIALWIVTWHLLAPVLRWPLALEPVRRDACIRLALATLVIPLALSLLTRGEGQETLPKPTLRDRLRLWALKLAGAMTGFDAFAALAVLASLVWYYLAGSPVTGFASSLLTLLPLFWGYVAARRIPLDRLKMYQGKLLMHSADLLVLAVYPFFGLLLAFIIYYWQWLLADPLWGPLALLACVSLIAAMELRSKRRKERRVE